MFRKKQKPILVCESMVINECLTILRGFKSAKIFEYKNDRFYLNAKYQLKDLSSELLENSLKRLMQYGEIATKICEFIETSRDQSSNSCNENESDNQITQVYQVFAQCLNDYMNYFRSKLNKINEIVQNKKEKFTLIDLNNFIETPYASHFDILNALLNQISIDENKESKLENCQKSINLIVRVHQLLVDSYSLIQTHSNRSVLLVWLFVHVLKPYFNFIDKLLSEGLLVDTKHEFGFKRTDTTIHDTNYWNNSHQFLFNDLNYLKNLPTFIRIILYAAFKICKHIEVVRLFSEFRCEPNVYDKFMAKFMKICPFLTNTKEFELIEQSSLVVKESTLLDLNFNNMKIDTSNLDYENISNILSHSDRALLTDKSLKPISELFEYMETKSETEINEQSIPIYEMNIETAIQDILNECLSPYIQYFSNILIKNLIEKHHIYKYFEEVHSYLLFKANEIIFLFTRRIFELIKVYETYQDDGILNKLMYDCSKSIGSSYSSELFTPQDLFKVHYEYSDTEAQIIQNSPTRRKHNLNTCTRLITGISLNFIPKWPFNLIVKESDFVAYNKLFIHLLQIKQVKYDLDTLDYKELDINKVNDDETTDTETSDDNSKKPDKEAIKKMYLIRFRLTTFINCIHDLLCHQVYFLSDEFIENLKKLTNIDTILKLHKKFLIDLNSTSISQKKYFLKILLQIFDLILRFCDRWRRGIYAINKEILQEIEFEANENFLFFSNVLTAFINKDQFMHLKSLSSILLYSTR